MQCFTMFARRTAATTRHNNRAHCINYPAHCRNYEAHCNNYLKSKCTLLCGLCSQFALCPRDLSSKILQVGLQLLLGGLQLLPCVLCTKQRIVNTGLCAI